MKNFYVSAWVLFAVAAFVTGLTGAMSAAVLFAFSLVALGLVYTLALWSVWTNTKSLQTE